MNYKEIIYGSESNTLGDLTLAMYGLESDSTIDDEIIANEWVAEIEMERFRREHNISKKSSSNKEISKKSAQLLLDILKEFN